MDRLKEIEARKLEIRDLVENAENVEEIDALNEEVENLDAEEKDIKDKIEAQEDAEKIQNEEVIVEKVEVKEERKMNNELEVRNTKEYIDAYAEYLKTGKDEEVRSLLTTNATSEGQVIGDIAVPNFIYDEVKTAWEKSDIMSLVRKAEVKGDLTIQFEVSGSPAVVHPEGSGAVSEEELVEGIVKLTAQNIKKWISISDEVMDLRGEAFLRYIYDELTYRITKKAADLLVAAIAGLPQTATATSPSANKITTAPSVSAIAQGIANLSDEATDYTIIMNKLTYAKFKEAQYANGYGVDVFEGCRVRFNNTLPAYDTAADGAVYAIVGDLNHGTIANFPNGIGNVQFKFDELSRKKEDLVEVLGREFVGMGVVADKAFTLLAKPTE